MLDLRTESYPRSHFCFRAFQPIPNRANPAFGHPVSGRLSSFPERSNMLVSVANIGGQ
jgi:hypothetical protein